jgi:hypothetical protein
MRCSNNLWLPFLHTRGHAAAMETINISTQPEGELRMCAAKGKINVIEPCREAGPADAQCRRLDNDQGE